ncbi:hypothetical protein [Flavobacterium chungangense]|uniref:Uncharacterized protein n=1 Tax=Flavobacterium chungangense TaxID=554283 RepID=A0A6V6Z6A0_9FLAO|nr:hypothetical protein [Flavobacterium chungangense]CAD0007106.1 hypothetical protein FLACHUCJ7_03178 [Flavobacterium chungangense]
MDFGLTADINWESGVREVLNLIPNREFSDFFYSKNYGIDLNDIFIVLMCRNSEYNFKQRIRFIKKEKALYMDIMLDFDLFLKITQEERNRIVFEKLIKEVPEIIAKYKFKNFDLDTFKQDWTGLIKSITY